MANKLPGGMADLHFEIFETPVNIFATHAGRIISYQQFPEPLLLIIDAMIALRPRVVKALDLLGLKCADARRKQFIRCNMASFDFTPDVTECMTKVSTECVNCGCRDFCLFQNFLCGAVELDGVKLSLREIKVMALIRKGFLDKEIAETLYASPETIKTTKRNIQNKLKIERKAMIASVAADMQLT